MIKITFIGVLAFVFLSGCQMPTKKTFSQRPSDLQTTANQISHTQKLLYSSNVINEVPNIQPGTFSANSDRLSVNWEGDAIELLSQVARQRGLHFAYTGVRLPLPISIYERNITFENLLRQIKIQINWRASLIQHPQELRLYFSSPDKGGRFA
ncbi:MULTISPECIES: DotD/TraH family lipoprotein [Edwardsiella]